MGYAPAQVDAMSLWEFSCCLSGWNRAQGGKPPSGGGEGMSAERARELGIEGF